MSEIPDEAVQEAARVLHRENPWSSAGDWRTWEEAARAALAAAAPHLLADATLGFMGNHYPFMVTESTSMQTKATTWHVECQCQWEATNDDLGGVMEAWGRHLLDALVIDHAEGGREFSGQKVD